MKTQRKAESRPAGRTLRQIVLGAARLLTGIGAVAATAAFNAWLFAFLPVWMTRMLHYSSGEMAVAQNFALIVLSAAIVAVGWLGDYVGRYWLLGSGAVLVAVLATPMFTLMVDHAVWPGLPMAVLALAIALCSGVFACVVADLFPTWMRYSGVGVSYNFSFALFGASFPLLATWLMSQDGMDFYIYTMPPWPLPVGDHLTFPALLFHATCGLTLVAAIAVKFLGGMIDQKAPATAALPESVF